MGKNARSTFKNFYVLEKTLGNRHLFFVFFILSKKFKTLIANKRISTTIVVFQKIVLQTAFNVIKRYYRTFALKKKRNNEIANLIIFLNLSQWF